MKIIGGEYRGRNFYMPADIRPTQNMARKAVFDLLGQDLTGLTFLDLFAGSGAVGLEALSRGASKVTFVERDPKFAGIIEKNLGIFGFDLAKGDQRVELIAADGLATVKALARQGRTFDIVFFDPPYGMGLVKKSLKTLTGYDILPPKSHLVIEHSHAEILPDLEGRFSIVKQKRYGKTLLSVCESL